MFLFSSFKNIVSTSNTVNWKVSKHFAHTYMDGRAYISLPFCLSELERKFNNFWWTKRIVVKFSGQAQLVTINFWEGISYQPVFKVRPWAQKSLFLENLSPHWVSILQRCYPWHLNFLTTCEQLCYIWSKPRSWLVLVKRRAMFELAFDTCTLWTPLSQFQVIFLSFCKLIW